MMTFFISLSQVNFLFFLYFIIVMAHLIVQIIEMNELIIVEDKWKLISQTVHQTSNPNASKTDHKRGEEKYGKKITMI